MKELTCTVCGRRFYGYKNQKYCSHECALAARQCQESDRSVARHAVGRDCVVCGKRFYPSHRGHKTCSDECRAAWESMRRGFAKPLGSIAKCEECGKEYVVQTSNAKYCSMECRKRANHRQAAKEYKEIHAVQKKKKRVEVPKVLSLQQAVREAMKLGLSYGQYVARLEAEEI